MSNLRNRLRCELTVSKAPHEKFFNKLAGESPKCGRASQVDWELLLKNDDESPFDISGLTSLTLQITDASGTVQVTKTITSVASASNGELNAGCTQDQWDALTHQHALVLFTDTEMTFTAGSTYLVTVSGVIGGRHTLLGRADFELVQAYINAGSATVTPGKTPIYAEDLAGILAGFAKIVNEPGVMIYTRSPDGLRRIGQGTDNGGNPIQDIV